MKETRRAGRAPRKGKADVDATTTRAQKADRKELEPVPLEQTLLRLFTALRDMKKTEDLLLKAWGEINFPGITEVQHAILDLCGIPQDNSATRLGEVDCFCRELWTDLFDALTPKSDLKEFTEVIRRIGELRRRFVDRAPAQPSVH